MGRRIALLASLGVFPLLASGQDVSPADREKLDFFESRVRPVLVDRCLKCHSPEGDSVKGGLRLDTREAILRGGDSGPAVVPGEPERSPLIKAVRYIDQDLQMPPKGRLAPQQVADLESWVRMGAPHSVAGSGTAPRRRAIDFSTSKTFWSFQPVGRPAVPPVRDGAWPRTSIDRFLLARMEEKGVRPSAEADRRTLIRRATFDLTGLPPTPDEVDAFLRDDSPDAFDRVVDRLLASPHYGERWGRHWLDVVRYADTAGDNSDYPVPQASKYRDYVIDAFNRDTPYDVFLREQIAGDLLPFASDEERRRHIVATGFIAIARRFGLEPDVDLHLTIDDTIDTLGRAVMGLSLSCARCHDHKFDPVPTEDYYGLYGIFQSTRYPFPGGERMRFQKDFVPLLPREKADELLKPWDEKFAELDAKFRALKDELASAEKDGRDEVRRRIPEIKKALGEAGKKRDEIRRQRPEVDDAYAVAEGTPANARIQIKGNPKSLGDEVERHFLQVLGGGPLSAGSSGSGRLELARWLTDPGHPLTARVMANRLWQHHFGKGLVATPSNFGTQGLPPTHPELLDHLAQVFVDDGWSIKAMHRRIMTSRAYRQASIGAEENAARDPSDELLWKFPRRRLSAEEIRDAMLAVSGALDRAPGGPHPFPPRSKWEYSQATPFQAMYPSDRRSVYLLQPRTLKHPYLSLFDGPDPNSGTPVRPITTTPIQALFVMNSRFVRDQAERLAASVSDSGGDADRIDRLHLLLFARPATGEERARGVAFLEASRRGSKGDAWASLAHALLSTSEFITLD